MKYKHDELITDDIIRHWCNEINDQDDPLYRVPTYKVHKIDTSEYYDIADDLVNSKRIEMGLEPYYYEVTDIPVETYEEEEIVEEDVE